MAWAVHGNGVDDALHVIKTDGLTFAFYAHPTTIFVARHCPPIGWIHVLLVPLLLLRTFNGATSFQAWFPYILSC
jgi:hypothetical protein